jgi:hypothetical protein
VRLRNEVGHSAGLGRQPGQEQRVRAVRRDVGQQVQLAAAARERGPRLGRAREQHARQRERGLRAHVEVRPQPVGGPHVLEGRDRPGDRPLRAARRSPQPGQPQGALPAPRCRHSSGASGHGGVGGSRTSTPSRVGGGERAGEVWAPTTNARPMATATPLGHGLGHVDRRPVQRVGGGCQAFEDALIRGLAVRCRAVARTLQQRPSSDPPTMSIGSPTSLNDAPRTEASPYTRSAGRRG